MTCQTKTGFPKALQKRHEAKQHSVVFLHQMVRKFYLLPKTLDIEDKRDFLKNYTMVSFVRHPFIRLVSTYKDKLIESGWKHWRSLMNYDDDNPYGAFETFIRLIVDREPIIAENWHVFRYWERCDYCNIDYKIIGKMETFTQDVEYTMTNVGMNKDNLGYHENISSEDSTEDLAIQLFLKLPKDLVEKLYELYKIDFEMFQYDPKPYGVTVKLD